MYRCKKCGYKSSYKSSMESHIRNSHGSNYSTISSGSDDFLTNLIIAETVSSMFDSSPSVDTSSSCDSSYSGGGGDFGGGGSGGDF